MEKTIINVEDVRFSYITAEGVAPIVLDGVTLDIEEGSFVAVLGHNGSGKSTLAKHMNAILLPTGGKVYVDGMDTADEDKLLDIRRTVGMVFQNPDNQIVANVVEEDVAFAPENLGVPPEEIRRRVDDALKAVGMYQYREHAPHLLSGGQKQRIAIAGVIAMEPRCIVLDEPTAMLDPIGRADVLRTIKTLNRERGGHRGPHHPPHGRGRPGRPPGGHGQGENCGRRRPQGGVPGRGGPQVRGAHRPRHHRASLGAATGGTGRAPGRPQRRRVRPGAEGTAGLMPSPCKGEGGTAEGRDG